MKIDPELISCALEEAFKQGEVAPLDSVRLTFLTAHWESVALRSSDLDAGLEELHKQGRIDLEIRGDGIWVRRMSNGGAPGSAIQRMRALYLRLMGRLMFDKVRRRENDGYCGMDRRGRRSTSTDASSAT